MSGVILAFAEQRNNEYRKPAYEVTSAAARLAKDTGGEAAAVVVGSGVEGMAAEIGKYGAARVAVCDSGELKDYTGELYAAAVCLAVEALKPTVILFPHSAMGKDLAPRVAACLGHGLAADCTEIKFEDGNVQARRPIFAGKVHAWIESKTDCFVATLRPNVFAAEELGGAGAAESVAFTPPGDGKHAVLKEIVQEASGKIELTEADIIVSGGRGMKGPENYKILEELAAALKGAVGASRASVDAGWRPHSDQVGQTGKTVSPTLYIACGISGAIQHLAGMSSSKFIVAINKDADAPIFKVADYGIVGDLFEIIPAMIEEAKKLDT
jgi:electron transfer flavoprotein alpha subunit